MENLSIYKKLLEIQKQMPRIDKDAQNEFFSKGNKKVTYSTLPNVLSIVLPLLNAKGILFSNEQKYLENIGWIIIVELIDTEDGSKKTTMLPLLNVTDMQKMGGCITYGQRYGLLPMLGISPELDDDGNSTAQQQSKAKEIIAQAKPKSIKSFWIELTEDDKKKLKEAEADKYYTIESTTNEVLAADIIDRRIKWVKEVLGK